MKSVPLDYSYQKPLIKKTLDALLNSGKTVVLAACPSAGKTHMSLEITKQYYERFTNAKTLFFTHGQILLRDQWHEIMHAKVNYAKHGVITKGKDSEQVFEDSNLIVALPQTLANAKVGEVDLVIVDESHQRFLATQMQELLKRLKPKHILLLTGTPSYFINNSAYEVVGITIEELLDYNGVVTDPWIEIVQSDYAYSLSDFDRSTMRVREDKFTTTETIRTLNHLLPQILKKLTQRSKGNPETFKWSSIKTWKGLSEKLQKSMIICNNQEQALDVRDYFAQKKIKCTISISHLSDGVEELEQFKKDPTIPIFIVVHRGTLGFNYEELINVVDLSGSLNVNRIFQALCRIVRPSHVNPKQKKLFIKVTNKEMAHLTYFVMSFVVALSTKEFYYNYETEYRIDDVPVRRSFTESLEKSNDADKPWPALPQVFSFSELKNLKGSGSIAYTNFKEVIRRVYSKTGKEFTDSELKKALANCKSRKDFEHRYPSHYYYMRRKRITKLLADYEFENWVSGLAAKKISGKRRAVKADKCNDTPKPSRASYLPRMG